MLVAPTASRVVLDQIGDGVEKTKETQGTALHHNINAGHAESCFTYMREDFKKGQFLLNIYTVRYDFDRSLLTKIRIPKISTNIIQAYRF